MLWSTRCLLRPARLGTWYRWSWTTENLDLQKSLRTCRSSSQKVRSSAHWTLNADLRLTIGITVYTQIIHKLVSASYLKPSTILSHVSPRDKRIQYETEEKVKISGFPTAKELREAKEVADARLRREEEEAEKVGLVSDTWIWFGLSRTF